MGKFDTLIKNGIIVTASDRYKGDIGIKDGKIEEISLKIADSDAKKVIDAEGKYVFPGGIDAHTHLDMPFGGTFSSDNFLTGTRAAAVGGTTSVIDYAIQPIGDTLENTAKIWREKADGKACIDYGIHIAVTDTKGKTLEEIPKMVKAGYSSYKVFMVYDNMRVEDDDLIKILKTASNEGAIIGVHCENYYVIKYLTEKFLKEGKIGPEYHPLSRPAVIEGEAANRAIVLSEIAKAPLMVVHSSCKESVEEIRAARAKGLPVMGETCPQYLLLSEECYHEENFGGSKYVMSPPIRNKSNWSELWRAVREGDLQTVSTDHCPFFMKQKELGINDFSKIPNGAPGIELRMPLMLTYGPKNGLSFEKIVEVTASNPAKIYGMYPKKGTIAVGSDADMFIYDPDKKMKVTVNMLHENVDYTPFEGFELSGYPVMTLSRGEVIAEDGEYTGKEGRGEFLRRGKCTVI